MSNPFFQDMQLSQELISLQKRLDYLEDISKKAKIKQEKQIIASHKYYNKTFVITDDMTDDDKEIIKKKILIRKKYNKERYENKEYYIQKNREYKKRIKIKKNK